MRTRIFFANALGNFKPLCFDQHPQLHVGLSVEHYYEYWSESAFILILFNLVVYPTICLPE